MLPLAWSEQLPTTVFSARDGLHTTVRRILVDSKGFLWFPGSEGLARFDGNGFHIFTQADGLPTSVTSDIVERRDGTYWVGVREHLCLFDPRPNRTRFQCESPNLGPIRSLLENEQGLWCVTLTGLWRRTTGTQSWKPVGGLEPNPGRQIHNRLLEDTRGDVWASTSSGLYRFRSNERVDRWTEGLQMDYSTALSETPGSIWVEVRDDGSGFDPERSNSGNGLKSMRRRAETLGRSLKIDSQPGAGATVTLRVPLIHRMSM